MIEVEKDKRVSIVARHSGCRGSVTFILQVDGTDMATETYTPGNGDRRRRTARMWANSSELGYIVPLEFDDLVLELEKAELNLMSRWDASDGADVAEPAQICPIASLIDENVMMELAWDRHENQADLVQYDRHTHAIVRSFNIEYAGKVYAPPGAARNIATPGGSIPGVVLLPCDYDEAGIDEELLRADVRQFIDRYVELSPGCLATVVEYVMLSWLHDAFDELPYLAFRTSDAGRGKSRALEVVGSVCYRACFCGGGSTAAATLRLLHTFGGTLVADEFDQRVNTELTADLTKILNQGFQRNRPLVKCEGESNRLVAYRCFGPKAFALRKGFGDDATESRVISVPMQQRTRSDIPINLPRSRFDAEALSLRNRLLAWRFHNFGTRSIDTIPPIAGLEDRFNQIGRPLLAVAGNEETRGAIIESLRSQQGRIADDRADSLAGEVFAAICAIANPNEEFTPGMIAKQVNEVRAAAQGVDIDQLRHPLTPHKVGWIIKKDLELPRARSRDGTHYSLEPRRHGQLLRRFDTSPTDLSPLPDCNDESPTRLGANGSIPPAGTQDSVGGNRGNDGNVCNGMEGTSAAIRSRTPNPTTGTASEHQSIDQHALELLDQMTLEDPAPCSIDSACPPGNLADGDCAKL